MILSVRPFELDDLDAAAEFAQRARLVDASVEPFGHRLGMIATGPRALLELWRVAVGEDARIYGIAFAALREGSSSEKPVLDFYAAVDPAWRRQSLGRALCEQAVSGAQQGVFSLRARVRETGPGIAFLRSLGFVEKGAQLQLAWAPRDPLPEINMPALRIRKAATDDEKTRRDYERLSNEAWKDAPESFATRSDEIAQLLAEQGRALFFADADGKAVAYLSGVLLGKSLGIEEVAVLPSLRRMGIGRALVVRALKDAGGAVLSVAESNKPARALYRSLGFAQTSRRLLFALEAP